ncbi:hypothetical protein SOASR014_37710 [Pectobacterium carotovorum subsp. carotovorum]|nr:hypothetical protein SOASR014_37710 [Pectobacterium carotovorum subsp. carotovorum]GLX46179.1 hypothetical protein Pcaca01_38470 [Pectobacterium carotovorum subsp. carotovorum]
MPTVPTVKGPQVSSQGYSVQPITARYSPEMFGAGLADAADKYNQAFGEAKQKADVALAQDALLQFQSNADEQYTKLQQLQGKNAIGQGEVAVAGIRARGEELAATLPEGRSRDLFMRQSNQLGMQYKRQVVGYETGQVRAFEDSRQQGLLSGWQTQVSNDPQMFTALAPLARQSIALYGASRGQSDEEINATWEKWKQDSAWSAGQNALAQNYMQTRQAVGEPSDIGGGMRVPASGAKGEARGVRNNNPGNIRTSPNRWDGQTGDDGEYVTFASPEHGIRALGKNLLSYNRQGYDTVSEIIGRWAPRNENLTDAYIAAVSQKLDVSPIEPIDLTDPSTLSAMSKAIIQQENGKTQYTEEQINSGVSAALGLSSLPNSGRSTGVSWFDSLTPYQQATLQKQMDAQGKQQQAEYRAGLESTIKDANAAYMRGQSYPSPPPREAFINAYGYKDGLQNFEQFEKNKLLGADISTVQNLTPSAQQSLLDYRRPTPGVGYSADATRYDSLVEAVDIVNKSRTKDPIQYAIGQQQAQPLNLSSPQSLAQGMSTRGSMAVQISQQYGTPLSVFTKQESAQLGQIFKDAPVSQQVEYLDAIRQNTNNNITYMSALKQVSESAPSAAVAGIIMDKPVSILAQSKWIGSDVNVNPSDAAMTILEGNKARKGEKGVKGLQMPKESDLRSAFASTVQDAFAGDVEGSEMAFQVASDYYAGLMQKSGNITGELDSNAWQQSISVATGGVYDYNGQGNVLLPWGMSESDFDNAVNSAWKSQVVDAGIKAPVGQYGLQSHGDSQYLIKLGSGYLSDSGGRPVVLDLQQQRQRFIGDIPQ